MSITQSVTPEAEGTPVPTSGIDNSFDEQGHQTGADDLFEFDQPETPVDDTPIVQPAPGDEIVDDTPAETPVDEDGLEGVRVEEENQPKPEEQPTPKAEEPQTELKLYADKFKTAQDLKNAYVELGGDPANYGNDVGALEEAYRVRQSEFSRVRAEIAHNQPAPEPAKTFQELLNEEFAKYDPTKFEGPADMWKAQTEATAAAAAKFEQQQNQPKADQITPQEMDKQIKSLNEMHAIETKVPRLKSDKQFRNGFATHIMQMRQENRLIEKSPGVIDLDHAMKDYIGGVKSLVEEASKAYNQTQTAKNVSTATNSENAPTNPANSPSTSPEDDILNGILEAQAADARKYN